MSNQSIFAGVLNRELAFTALLANLLRRPGKFREAIFRFLTGDYLPGSSVEVISEFRSEAANRHDIHVKFGGIPGSTRKRTKSTARPWSRWAASSNRF